MTAVSAAIKAAELNILSPVGYLYIQIDDCLFWKVKGAFFQKPSVPKVQFQKKQNFPRAFNPTLNFTSKVSIAFFCKKFIFLLQSQFRGVSSHSWHLTLQVS